MKKNLLSGLVLLLPLAVTIFVFQFLIDLLTTPFLSHVKELIRFFGDSYVNFDSHNTFLILVSRTLILVMLFLGILILGFLGKWIFFHYFMKMLHKWMMKIPLINIIYKNTKDIIGALLSEDKKLFSRVVVVPFPNEHSRSIGLVTGSVPFVVDFLENTPIPAETTLRSVFVATSPHPLSGFLLLTEEKYLKPIDFTVEDAFKYLISCGVYAPSRIIVKK